MRDCAKCAMDPASGPWHLSLTRGGSNGRHSEAGSGSKRAGEQECAPWWGAIKVVVYVTYREQVSRTQEGGGRGGKRNKYYCTALPAYQVNRDQKRGVLDILY